MDEPAAVAAFRDCLRLIQVQIDRDRAATVPGRGFRWGTELYVWVIRGDNGRYAIDRYDGPADWRPQIEAEVERLNDG